MRTLHLFLLSLLVVSGCQSFFLDERAINLLRSMPKQLRPSVRGEPGTDNKTCQGLWYKHGFVCDKQNALLFNEMENEYLEFGERMFNKTVSTVSSISKFLLDNPSRKVRITEEEKELLSRYADNSYVLKAKQAADQCWNEMSRLRNSLVCSICSGDNFNFFFRGKAVVNLDDCNSLMINCDKHFLSFTRLFRVQRLLIKVDKQLSLLPFSLGTPIFKLISFLTKTMSHLILERSRAKSEQDKDRVTGKLCSLYFKVKRRPWLPKVTKVINWLLKIIQRRIVFNSKVRNFFKRKNWHRQLQGISDLQLDKVQSGFNSSDILVVKKTDNMFTSIDGIKGSTLDSESQSFKPMNLSLAFP